MGINFQGLAAELLAQAETLVPQWLPAGKKQGNEWVVGDLAGAAGESCKINLNTGKFADFASDVKGGDLIALYAAIHGLGMGEAARQLSPEPVAIKTNGALMPALTDDPRGTFRHSKHGQPSAWWTYTDESGAITGYICRYDPADGRKQIVPWRYIDGHWHAKGWPKPRPLYRLHTLAEAKHILIVEGEKAAEAARQLLTQYIVTTWQGGAGAVAHVDWSPLKGKPVLLWPDADLEGVKAMQTVARTLHDLGCSVRLLRPEDAEPGWDLADALAEGWDKARTMEWAKARTEDYKPMPAVPSVPPRKAPPVLSVVEGNTLRKPEFRLTSQEITDSDIANAKRLHARHGRELKFTTERGWLVWTGKRWEPDEKAVAVQSLAKETALALFDEIKNSPDQAVLYKHARSSQSKKAIEAMIWMSRSEPGIPARITEFDANPWLFNVSNGTIDLQTGELREHRPEDLITNISEVQFDPQASCELWNDFVMTITDKNEELYSYLRRLIGYLLVGNTSDQSLHFLYGSGANGKSVFCEVLARLLGDYSIIVSPEMLMTRRAGSIPNDVARLRGVRAAFANETAQGSRFDEAKIKDLTGGDSLNARFLHQEYFDFQPTHRIILRGNHKPTINGTDDGIWRRLRLVPFAVQIPAEKRNPRLTEELSEELPGILQWALGGLREWHAFDSLRPPETVLHAVSEYRSESDTLGRFIEEECETGKEMEIKASVFFLAYQKFCEASGERWTSSKELPDELKRRSFGYKRTEVARLYTGLRIKIPVRPRDEYDDRF